MTQYNNQYNNQYNKQNYDKTSTNKKRNIIIAIAAVVAVVLIIGFFPLDCPACEGVGVYDECRFCVLYDGICKDCNGTGREVCSRCDGEGTLPLFLR